MAKPSCAELLRTSLCDLMDKLTMKVLGLPKGQAWSECNRILLQSRLSPRRYSDMQTEIEIVEPQSTQRHIEESPVAHLGRQTDRHDFLLLGHPLAHTCQTRDTPCVPCASAHRTGDKDRNTQAQDTPTPRLVRRQEDLDVQTFDPLALGDTHASEIAQHPCS